MKRMASNFVGYITGEEGQKAVSFGDKKKSHFPPTFLFSFSRCFL
jgi:hypothetical protein